MSKFYNLEGQSVVVEAALDDLRPVEEGWGDYMLQMAAAIIGGIPAGLKVSDKLEKIGLKKWGTINNLISGLTTAGGALAGVFLFKLASSRYFKGVINNANFKKYLEEKANEVLKAAKKEDKTIVSKFDDIEKELKAAMDNCEDRQMGDEYLNFGKYLHEAKIDVGNFSIIAIGDSQSIKRLAVVLWSEEKQKLMFKDLPIPSKMEIKEICGQKEEAPAKESMEVAEEGWFTVFQTVLQGVQRSFVGGVEKIQAFDAKFQDMLTDKFNKVLENDLVKNHIKAEADKLFAEEKKSHKKLVKDVSDASTLEKEFDAEAKGQVKAYSVKKATHYLLRKSGKVGEYTVILLADPDSKKALKIKVVFFDPAENKYIARDIAAPNA